MDQFKLEVIGKDQISHDTYRFTLKFPNAEWISGLWPSAHLFWHLDIDGKQVTRKYTPVSPINQKGTIVFVIKIYRENPEFPGGGVFTQALEKNLQVGSMLTCEGPIGKINYRGWGDFTFMKKQIEPKVNKVILNAAGTGITPMLSIAQASSLAKDGLQIFFLYSNKTKDDILCEKELNELVAMNPDNFKLVHTLTRHDPAKHGEWSGKTGRVSWEMY